MKPIATVTIRSEVIIALLVIAAKNALKGRLKEVTIEVTKNHAVLVSTDGHRLLAYRIRLQDEPLEDVSLLIPVTLLESVKKKTYTKIIIGDKVSAYSRALTIETGGIALHGTSIDVSPLEWKPVVPESVSGEVAQYSPKYVADFGEINDILCGKSRSTPIIHHNGKGPAVVELGDENAFALLMPVLIRNERLGPVIPDWCK